MSISRLINGLVTAMLAMSGNFAQAQTNLPPCLVGILKYQCFGEEVYADGSRYVGQFQNGRPNWQGTLTYPDGSSYVGEFIFGVLYGRGTFTWLGGQKYVGEFKGNRRDGKGIQYDASGAIQLEGIWVADRFVGSEPTRLGGPLGNPLAGASVLDQAQEQTRPGVAEEATVMRKREQDDQLKQSQPTVLAQAASPSIGKRVALVIGNAAYKIHPLHNPRNDADDVSRSLKGSGFEVIDLRDASLTQMRSAIRQFGDKLLTSDTGLVYYSGHGIEIRGRNYFIPVNADIQREDEVSDQSLDVALILEKMSTAQKAVNILIVDACRDDPFGRSFRSGSKGLASMEAPRGTIVAYATSPGKVAADGDGRNSPYTKHLVRAMQTPNKPIELVFKEVRRAVQDETKNLQTPWENTSLSGDFYFRIQK